ncbi:Dip2/Utp12 family-domain-containing protein [Bombardia bombarda]|uniref:Dip2/Utp12 family-domain-containing protein n=1 Tax=Bombardia bombarda TaxID=252184 RepID=A0AA40CD59_9PEZI|nr:Dip2/Utp12 family-domain-containing protein [Bombardia bombarda]
MSTNKRKPLATLARPVVQQSAKTQTRAKIDETRTAVSTGHSLKPASKPKTETIEISSDSESHYSSDNEEVAESEDEAATKPTSTTPDISKLKASQDAAADLDGAAQETGDASDAEETSPTFGDLVRGTSTIDVPASLAAQAAAQVARSDSQQRSLVPINSTSLGTVLNQALRTDDADLLESCLQTNDVKIIQNTINRMDSALAGALLSKLAARMHRRPGRAFGLMKWMQWTLVAHGGSLVTQPDLVNRLGELNRVLEERARGLPNLLALKGKLDMLDAQMRFRKSIKTAGLGRRVGDDEESDEEAVAATDEAGLVYVEGDGDLLQTLTNGSARNATDDEDDFPVANGIGGDSDDESEDEDYEDVDEFAAEESLDEDEVDHDDVEESGEEDDSDGEDAGPPAKVQKVSTKFAKRK